MSGNNKEMWHRYGKGDGPWGIDIRSVLDEHFEDLLVATGGGGVEGEDAVEDGVDGLAVLEGILDEADVSRGGGGVEAEAGDCEE